jgi:hypothetical protein
MCRCRGGTLIGAAGWPSSMLGEQEIGGNGSGGGGLSLVGDLSAQGRTEG